MGFTLESFASDVHRILKEDPDRAGREKVGENIFGPS